LIAALGGSVATARKAHMVDVVRVKLPKQRRPFLNKGSGRIRSFQPNGELPLQTRCRNSGQSFSGQPQDARSASRHRTDASCRRWKTCHTGKEMFRDKAPGQIIW